MTKMCAIPKMPKILKKFQGKALWKSSYPLKVRRLLYPTLRPLYLSRELRRRVSNKIWTVVGHRKLMLSPPRSLGYRAWLQPFRSRDLRVRRE